MFGVSLVADNSSAPFLGQTFERVDRVQSAYQFGDIPENQDPVSVVIDELIQVSIGYVSPEHDVILAFFQFVFVQNAVNYHRFSDSARTHDPEAVEIPSDQVFSGSD